MPPGVHDGTVFVSTVPGNAKRFYAGSGQAVLWAMDASTGATKWKWDEVPDNLWSDKHTHVNSGGGQWYPPAFDGEGNLYVGVSNPAPFPGAKGFPWGSSRPGPNLYTDSIVKLDEQTGKVVWHYQLTPHDIYDWDLENSPILSKANGKQIVIDGGKAGILVAVDAQTGKPIWKRPVGVHNGHDKDNLAALEGRLLEAARPGDDRARGPGRDRVAARVGRHDRLRRGQQPALPLRVRRWRARLRSVRAAEHRHG